MKNLYVGNLPHSTTESELRNVFAVYGPVENVNIITDRDTGRWIERVRSSGAHLAS